MNQNVPLFYCRIGVRIRHLVGPLQHCAGEPVSPGDEEVELLEADVTKYCTGH